MKQPVKIGLLINPIAGMGGAVALKGTDGDDILSKAISLGAKPEAGNKAARTMKKLIPFKDSLLIVTCSDSMGEDVCRELGLPYEIIWSSKEHSSSQDTLQAAKRLAKSNVELLLFAGGDGTARDICQALGDQFPVLGIPAGVKIQSAVFALSPEAAGDIAAGIIQGGGVTYRKREVLDLDEESYRKGWVSATLYGSLLTPQLPAMMQSMKQSGFTSEEQQLEGIADYVISHMEPDRYYAVGPGTTAKSILKRLGLSCPLLGVDVIQNRQLLSSDMTEAKLWTYAQRGTLSVIVSPIGGQGFLFGRGNHQFSPRILKAVGKENITVVSPMSKLLSISGYQLHIDCGDEETCRLLRGYYSVVCGYGHFSSMKC